MYITLIKRKLTKSVVQVKKKMKGKYEGYSVACSFQSVIAFTGNI